MQEIVIISKTRRSPLSPHPHPLPAHSTHANKYTFHSQESRKYHVVFQIWMKEHYVSFLLQTNVNKHLVIKYNKTLQLSLILKPVDTVFWNYESIILLLKCHQFIFREFMQCSLRSLLLHPKKTFSVSSSLTHITSHISTFIRPINYNCTLTHE